jgi:hypothetical protein
MTDDEISSMHSYSHLLSEVQRLHRLLDKADQLYVEAEFAKHDTNCPQTKWAQQVLDGDRDRESDFPECACWQHGIRVAMANYEFRWRTT